ncbi:MAG: hypothetical protein ACKVX7_07565 [Planctomycetota bacterium]
MRYRAKSRPLFLVAFVAAGLWLIAGCTAKSSTEDSGDASVISTEVLEQEKAKAEAAKLEADKEEAPKYGRTEYELGANGILAAETSVEKNEPNKAVKKYKQATRDFAEAIKKTKDRKAKHDELFKIKAEYDKLRVDAITADVPKLMPKEWENLEAEVKRAVEQISDGKTQNTKSLLNTCVREIKENIARTAEKKKHRTRAEEAKTEMVAWRQKAEELDAANIATSEFEFAKTKQKLAETRFEDGDFESAAREFSNAKLDYTEAFAAAKRKQDGPQVAAAPTPDAGVEKPKVDDVSPGPVVRPKVEGTGESAPLEIKDLFKGSPQLNGNNLQLDYVAEGKKLQQDVRILRGKSEHVKFAGNEGVGVSEYTLAGNTEGLVIIQAGFQDEVRIAIKFYISMFVPQPVRNIEFLFNSTRDASSYNAVRLGNSGLDLVAVRNGNEVGTTPSANKEQNRDANVWLNRRDPHDLEIRYERENKDDEASKDSIVTVLLDGEEVIKTKAKSGNKGFVGFKWKDTKFILENIQVAGNIDLEWAEKALEDRKAKK